MILKPGRWRHQSNLDVDWLVLSSKPTSDGWWVLLDAVHRQHGLLYTPFQATILHSEMHKWERVDE